MHAAVIVFPGSNCDRDLAVAFKAVGAKVSMVWHKDDALPEGTEVMLKLSLPTKPGQYAELIAHPKVLRVVALSGGYSREEANTRLAKQTGMIASFSRALTEGLSAQQSDADFDAVLAATIEEIHGASVAG